VVEVGNSYKALAVGVDWKVINVIGPAEEGGGCYLTGSDHAVQENKR
jgi:hypothetical protein